MCGAEVYGRMKKEEWNWQDVCGKEAWRAFLSGLELKGKGECEFGVGIGRKSGGEVGRARDFVALLLSEQLIKGPLKFKFSI